MTGFAPLAEALDESTYGGKAAQLAAALGASLPVPEGIALSWSFVDALAGGDAAARRALERALASLDGPLAVRSSAIGEDSAEASFAGVHLSVLNVLGAVAVEEAVRASWASARTDSALAYRRSRGLSDAPRAAVLLQRFVDPEVSGVAFTRHPVTGADEIVIEAAWGLGEALVGGLVTPDHHRLSRDGRVVERRLGDKDLALRAHACGGTEEVAVESVRAGAPCLDDAALARVHGLALACDVAFGSPSDVEWAVAGGTLHLLQRRAITTLPR